MQHLNLCRQAIKALSNYPIDNPLGAFLEKTLERLRIGQKFLLPDGGVLYDDPLYKAIDETKPLSLPFPVTVLEYVRPISDRDKKYNVEHQLTPSSKTIVIAVEEESFIRLSVVCWLDEQQFWAPMPEVGISRTNYIDRSKDHAGRTQVLMYQNFMTEAFGGFDDYGDEIRAFLNFINILQCSNVHIDRSVGRPLNTVKKGALPFDSYHILTIDSSNAAKSENDSYNHTGRSPREHLRRGHIRRLTHLDGRRIWINAAVINAGSPGVVHKTYKMEMA